jgi:hypothetical protein
MRRHRSESTPPPPPSIGATTPSRKSEPSAPPRRHAARPWPPRDADSCTAAFAPRAAPPRDADTPVGAVAPRATGCSAASSSHLHLRSKRRNRPTTSRHRPSSCRRPSSHVLQSAPPCCSGLPRRHHAPLLPVRHAHRPGASMEPCHGHPSGTRTALCQSRAPAAAVGGRRGGGEWRWQLGFAGAAPGATLASGIPISFITLSSNLN